MAHGHHWAREVVNPAPVAPVKGVRGVDQGKYWCNEQITGKEKPAIGKAGLKGLHKGWDSLNGRYRSSMISGDRPVREVTQ